MQIPSGGPVPSGQTGPGSWNPTRQQLDQLETILQKMIKNPVSGEQIGAQTQGPTPYWAGSPMSPPANPNTWPSPPPQIPQSNSIHQSFQSPKPPDSPQSLNETGWNPSQTTWGPLAETWRNQQTPFTQLASPNPGWVSQQAATTPQTTPSQTTPYSGPKTPTTRVNSEDYGEIGISWLINAIIDMPLRLMGPPGRFFMSWTGRHILGVLGITMLAYSGILVASDWMEWPWADRLIPSNLVRSILQKAG